MKGKLGGTSRWDGAAKEKAVPPEQEDKADDSAIAPRDIAYALKEARGDRDITLTRVPLGWAADSWEVSHPLDYLGNDGGGGSDDKELPWLKTNIRRRAAPPMASAAANYSSGDDSDDDGPVDDDGGDSCDTRLLGLGG